MRIDYARTVPGGSVTRDLGSTYNPDLDSKLRRQDAALHMSERKMPMPRWCPSGLSKTQRRRLQKLRRLSLLRNEQNKSVIDGLARYVQ
jgi:hypothetical protein